MFGKGILVFMLLGAMYLGAHAQAGSLHVLANACVMFDAAYL